MGWARSPTVSRDDRNSFRYRPVRREPATQHQWWSVVSLAMLKIIPMLTLISAASALASSSVKNTLTIRRYGRNSIEWHDAHTVLYTSKPLRMLQNTRKYQVHVYGHEFVPTITHTWHDQMMQVRRCGPTYVCMAWLLCRKPRSSIPKPQPEYQCWQPPHRPLSISAKTTDTHQCWGYGLSSSIFHIFKHSTFAYHARSSLLQWSRCDELNSLHLPVKNQSIIYELVFRIIGWKICVLCNLVPAQAVRAINCTLIASTSVKFYSTIERAYYRRFFLPGSMRTRIWSRVYCRFSFQTLPFFNRHSLHFARP